MVQSQNILSSFTIVMCVLFFQIAARILLFLKKNIIEKFIYEDNNLFFTDKVGYPQFYTQLLFEKNNTIIRIKTVINNEEALSKVSTCKKVEIFDNES